MVKNLFLALGLLVGLANVGSAAILNASGTFNLYVGVPASDPNVINQTFRIFAVTNDATGAVESGFLRIAGPSTPVTHQFTPNVGNLVIGGASSTWAGIQIPTLNVGPPAGGQLIFNIPIAANGLNNFENLRGAAGSANFVANNGGFYTATIVASPEPSSALALAGLIAGCTFIRRRRA